MKPLLVSEAHNEEDTYINVEIEIPREKKLEF